LAKEEEEMRRKLFALALLAFLISSLFSPVKVEGRPADEHISIEGLKDIYLRGQSVNFTVYANRPKFTLEIYLPNGNLWLNRTYEANATLNFPIPDNAPYGFYMVKAYTGHATVTRHFTLLDGGNWQPVTFPYVVKHKGVTYTFYSNGSFIAQGRDGTLKLDFTVLVKLIKLLDMTITARKNSMCFKVTLTKTSLNLKVELIWAFVYKGCKFAVRGTIDRSRTLVWKLSKFGDLRRLVASVRSGHLVFDWSDIISSGYSCTYNRMLNALEISVDKTFVLDPYIFEDGFESGDFSAWSGTSANYGVVSITSSPIHHGSYAANLTVTAAASNAYANIYKLFTSRSDCYARSYVYFIDLMSTDGRYSDVMFLFSGSGVVVASLRIYQDSGITKWVLKYRNASAYHEQIINSPLPQTNTWYCVEIRAKCSSSDGIFDGQVELWIDGTLILNVQNLDTDTTSVNTLYLRRGWYGGVTDVGTTIYDCVVIDSTYIEPEITNSAPTIGNIEAASTVYANQYFTVNCTVNDADGATDIENVTLNLGNGVVLKWDNDTNTFSESQDTNNYCTLNASASTKTSINSSAFKLSFNLKLNNYPAGTASVTGTVYDGAGTNGTKTESNLFTLSYPTLTLQARDADGNNLPLTVTFKGTLGNGTSFTANSNANGQKQLTTCYGTHTINVWWGTHLIGTATTSVASSKTVNIDTKIRKATLGSDYLLASLNNTDLPAPTVISGTEVKFAGVTASGTIQLRLDVSHWHVQDEPVKVQVGDYIYKRGATGWGWDSVNKVWSFSVHFSTQDIIIYWEETSTSDGGGSSGGTTTQIPAEPEETGGTSVPTVPAQPTIPESYVVYKSPFTVDTTMVAVALIVICVVFYLANHYLSNYGSVSKLWRKRLERKRKVKWKK